MSPFQDFQPKASRTFVSHGILIIHLQVLEQLESRGRLPLVVGDGTNDAPAVMKAKVGVAMGCGTNVTKTAADVILTDNNFMSLSRIIVAGRMSQKKERRT